ncbi:MAG: hypothetical protein KGD64_12080, partial [Candidatus Heimdallarchaeota archaeon]|nr:hypothetical protein [Candidatus Heimdallarchaeota archaeon]
TIDDMDVLLYYQSDDHAKVFAEGEQLSLTDPSWNRWTSEGAEVTIAPGSNYFLMKSQDTGGNWDAQVLFVDTGETDELEKLQSRWPIVPTQTVDPSDPDALRYRTSSDDSGTSSATFPGPGYTLHKWFLLGRLIPEVNANPGTNMQVDYFELNGYANETTYRPFEGSGDTFSTDIGIETGNEFMTYQEAGNQIGVIDFIGDRFDSGDTLDWSDDGIVYAAAYIYNPTATIADVSIACQSDDFFKLWVNDQMVYDDTVNPVSWNVWCPLQNITLNPGLNYILIKSGDSGGNWDVNIILHDRGAEDDLSKFICVWPDSAPSLIVKNINQKQNVNTVNTQFVPIKLEQAMEFINEIQMVVDTKPTFFSELFWIIVID